MTSIQLYTLSTCVYCKRLKKYLKDNGYEFGYIDVDTLSGREREEALLKVMELNPSISFPTAVINGVVIMGHDIEKIEKALRL
ncbi:MAG: glutaredoxin family protein [ANME-2 cluster archaeon]|jgi:glutaredoxin-like protein NrdH|nr:glutaredoxin family protein [ANME-2 cluster archaeon]